MTEEKALTVRQKQTATIERLVSDRASKLLEVMPKGMDSDRFVRTTLIAISRDENLLNCTPESLVTAIFEAAECGIEPTGSLGRGYLVPIKDHGVPKAEFWIGYPGLIELAMRSERVSKVWSRPVFKGDDFEVTYGTRDEIIHHPQLGAEVKAGDLTHVYACVQFKDGAVDFEVLTKEQCDLVRARARGAGGAQSPWNTDYIEQCRKTAIRKLGKRMPLTAEAARAIQRDEEREFGFEARRQEAAAAEKKTDALGDTLRAKAGRKAEAEPAQEAEPTETDDGPMEWDDLDPRNEAIEGEIISDAEMAARVDAESVHAVPKCPVHKWDMRPDPRQGHAGEYGCSGKTNGEWCKERAR